MTRILLLALALSASVSLAGCTFNIFQPFDSPNGDAQLLSAARAALDRGDFAKALEYYGRLSSSQDETKASEQAYTVLAQYNAGMAAFASAFGSGGGGGAGKGITQIANAIGGAAGAQARLDIFHAFQQTGRIPDNAPLRGLVRFLTSIALIAELLDEAAASQGQFETSDLALDATACLAGEQAACGTTPGCAPPASPVLGTGPTTVVDLNLAQDSDIEAGPSLSLVQSAIDQIGIALGASEIGSSGSLSGSVNSFTQNPELREQAFSVPGAPCYRFALLSNGIGTN